MILESWNLTVTERLNFETGNVTDLFASNFARARDATTGCRMVTSMVQWNHEVCSMLPIAFKCM